ncbi:hypothetical protein AcW1_008787 [Taiwanofungus camphoratus]|nr:hypothetical protein AcW1_008787 [Antrodia cinnamomea]
MTRYTNFARKRTYLQANLNYNDALPESGAIDNDQDLPISVNTAKTTDTGQNRKRRRKERTQDSHEEIKSSAEIVETGRAEMGGTKYSEQTKTEESERVPGGDGAGENGSSGESRPEVMKRPSSRVAKAKEKIEHKHKKDTDARKLASERRRLKRKDRRTSETVCYACREIGHTARDCTKAIACGAGNELTKGTKFDQSGQTAVGVCYRCGSRKHNLSRCMKSIDPSNPLPFASCFVCSGKGHLASSCPQNQSKGVYPNGGCCKLCGETTHLAKDCTLRKSEVVAKTVFLGTGRDAGADEDDFHTFRRRNAQVDKAEKTEERVKRQANIKIGAHTGVVMSFAKKPTTAKKVMYF